MKVGVVGAYGKLGVAVCEAVDADPELGSAVRVGSQDVLRVLIDGGVEVVVDVTNVAAARKNLPWYAMHGLHAVVGTTGFDDDDLGTLDRTYRSEGKSCFLVPNFSIGVMLMNQFAELAANAFDNVEIIEFHHNRKKDAPSGTSRATANRLAAARNTPWTPDPTEHETVAGARGGEAAPGIRVHSVRMPGLLAHQEVRFGGTGETLTIRHDSLSHTSFDAGALKAIKGVSKLPAGVTIGLDAVFR